MEYFFELNRNNSRPAAGARNYEILAENDSPCKGFSAGYNIYYTNEYVTPGVHDDNEGFYVIKGSGTARINDVEKVIREGSFFIAPAGAPHAIKKDVDCEELEILLFHFPVTE